MSIGGRLLVAANVGQPVEWLAIAGGAAVGAFVCGLAAQLLCRGTTGKKLPPLPLLSVRILGGVVAGVITAMCVLNGGGNGLVAVRRSRRSRRPTGPTNSDQKPEQPAPNSTNPAPPVTPPERRTRRRRRPKTRCGWKC